MTWDYATVSTAQIDPDTGMVTVTVVDESSGEQFPGIDMLHPIGFFSVPYSPTDEGSAQVLVARDVGNTDVAMGGTEERAASSYGDAKPGDTGIFSVGPKHAVKVLCKEESKTFAAVTEDTTGKNVVLTMNGAKDKIQINGFGLMFEMSRDQGIVLSDGGATLQIKDGTISLSGTVVLGGRTPLAPVHNGVGAGATSIPSPGVFVGS